MQLFESQSQFSFIAQGMKEVVGIVAMRCARPHEPAGAPQPEKAINILIPHVHDRDQSTLALPHTTALKRLVPLHPFPCCWMPPPQDTQGLLLPCDSLVHLPHIFAGVPKLAPEYNKLVKVKWSGRVVEEGRRQRGKWKPPCAEMLLEPRHSEVNPGDIP